MCCTRLTAVLGMTLSLLTVSVADAQIRQGSLRNGDYGNGAVINTFPLPGVFPGVVATPDGALFVATEASGRSNALINWQIGNNFNFRRRGTITFLFKAIRGQFSAAGGQIVGDNYGFNQFHNGQATFAVAAGPVVNGPGPEDDRVRVTWSTWHNNVWFAHTTTDLEYDRWYSLGFAWGGPAFEFEIWVDRVRKSGMNIAGSFPWGSDGLQSGFNMGLGDNHERGIDGYNSAAGVMFADARIWDTYRDFGDTVIPNDAPVGAGDDYSLDEDTPLTVNAPGVLGNDSDANGDDLSAALVGDVAHGTLAFNADGSFTYTPGAGYHGTDSFSYTANDGAEDSSVVTVTLTIHAINDAPTAVDDAGTTSEDTPTSADVVANDTDPDHDALIVTHASTASGSVAFEDGGLVFTPAANFHGVAMIGYTVSDGHGGTDEGLLTVTVTPVNDAPTATSASLTVAEDGSIALALSGDDVDGDALTFAVVSGPSHGTLSGAAPALTYTGAANYHGGDAITFEVSDGNGGTATGTITIDVTSVNDAPVPSPVSVTTAFETAVSVLLTATDADGDPLTFAVASPPSHGTLSGSGASLVYTPAAGFSGDDGFTYAASDGHGGTATAPVTIVVQAAPPPPVVNHAPIANADHATVREGAGVTIDVLANDTDPDGDPMTIAAVSPASLGLATLSPGGAISYQANLFGSLAARVAGVPGLSHGEQVSMQKWLEKAVAYASESRADQAAEWLEHIAKRLERATPQETALIALLRGLAAGGVLDQMIYTVSDGKGLTATATVTVRITLQ